MTLIVTNKIGLKNLPRTNILSFVLLSLSFLKEKPFYINTGTEVKFTKNNNKLSDHYKISLKML